MKRRMCDLDVLRELSIPWQVEPEETSRRQKSRLRGKSECRLWRRRFQWGWRDAEQSSS